MNIPRRVLLVFTLPFLISPTAFAGINIYISKFDQEAIEEAYTSSGVVFSTDTFDNGAANKPKVGVFSNFTGETGIVYTSTGSPEILGNNQYGGYQEGKYLGATSGSTVTATFTSGVQYFGLYISALDANNRIRLYNNATLLLDFSAATLSAFLPNNATSTVRAIDGSFYNTNQYYGQPTSNLNAGEPYAYVSFFATAGTTITSALLSESGAILETDNYSVRTAAPTVAGSLVLVPEPQTTSLMILSVGALALIATRRRKILG